jgi:NTE family protein
MIGEVIDVFRLRQYFNLVTGVREVGGHLREDLGLLHAARRALVTLPFEDTSVDPRPFPPRRRLSLPELRRRRFGFIATGGSGALASVVGCARAWEEAGVEPAVMSVCSGSSLFGFPLAAGLSAERVAEFTLSMDVHDFVDVNWPGLASLARGGRGFAGVIRGERIEAMYRRLLGDMRLGDLRVPCYCPVWSVESNRLEYLGPRTHPDLAVAYAIRAAISIPLFINPVVIGATHWCDGGIVDIFPTRPLLELEEPPEVVLAVNGFYPPDFAGEDISGWENRRASLLHIASQVRSCQQVELARVNLARLRDAADVLMIEPVPYTVVRGAGFYVQFLDHTDWPGFMRAGHRQARQALRRWAPPAAGRAGDGRVTAARAGRRRRHPQPDRRAGSRSA